MDTNFGFFCPTGLRSYTEIRKEQELEYVKRCMFRGRESIQSAKYEEALQHYKSALAYDDKVAWVVGKRQGQSVNEKLLQAWVRLSVRLWTTEIVGVVGMEGKGAKLNTFAAQERWRRGHGRWVARPRTLAGIQRIFWDRSPLIRISRRATSYSLSAPAALACCCSGTEGKRTFHFAIHLCRPIPTPALARPCHV